MSFVSVLCVGFIKRFLESTTIQSTFFLARFNATSLHKINDLDVLDKELEIINVCIELICNL
jgi:hypothetical protein